MLPRIRLGKTSMGRTSRSPRLLTHCTRRSALPLTCSCALVLTLFSLSPALVSSQSVSPLAFTEEHREAFQTLLNATRFEDEFLGFAQTRSKLVEAYCTLLREPGADRAFKNLLEHATLPGQLYALCGLYSTDSSNFLLMVQRYRHVTTPVEMQSGCIIMNLPASTIVEARKSALIHPIKPSQSSADHSEPNVTPTDNRKAKKNETDPMPDENQPLDILNGGYTAHFKCK